MNMPDVKLPSLGEAFRVWLKIGLLSFGGPAGQIALMHRVVVDELKWVGERRFLHALNFCTLLPGPEAQQLATYLGWLMHGVKGGLMAGLLFILPGAVVMLALSLSFVLLGHLPLMVGLFFGLKCAVLVLVVEALLRIGRRALKGKAAYGMAVAAFVGLFLLKIPFPAIVIGAGLIGLLAPRAFTHRWHEAEDAGSTALIDALLLRQPQRASMLAVGARRAGVAALALWLIPAALLAFVIGGTYGDIALFFSKMAVVTMGGAYAVLAYVAQDAVSAYHWLTGPEMLTGLGLAETTPGPLILVLQFVGFLAGYREDGVPGAMAGALITLWVTFAPCFAFVFLGAPWIERMQGSRLLAGGLAAVTAAVVGVIANLALWFALHVLFRIQTSLAWGPLQLDLPLPASIDIAAVGLALLAALALFRFRLGVFGTLAVTSVCGLVLSLI
ncbi:chromate efflux transporter [Dongia rigui]|uniref:Chromate efflux transporter n=1 Tax=Dongia rigui TaxID=940149 RepID=A0ABU5DXZ4_9PROT|nr:chromate efflux transporter [Dongia rigui]MDY0872187.1 chromate efflux transporter [Dongia rigui]